MAASSFRTRWNGAFTPMAFAAMVMCAPAWASDNVLTIVTDADYAPMYYTGADGTLIGQAIDMLADASAAADVELAYEIYPFNRAVSLAENTPNTCFLAFWRTPAREDDFQWVGPLAQDGTSVFARSGSDITITSVEDLMGYSVGVVNGWTIADELAQMGHSNLQTVTEDTQNVLKIGSGRIDLWISGSLSATYIAEQGGVEVENVFVISEVPLSIGCNLESDPALVSSLRSALPNAE